MSLVDDIRAGSSDAIKQLYQENAQDVYDFAKGITGNHDTAMQATKSTLSKLVQQIQNGSTPTNLHSEALKLAYDEACKIAMPSVDNIKSPYDDEEDSAPVKEKRKETAPARDKKRPEQRPPRKKERVYDDGYDEDDLYDDEDDYEEPSRQSRPRRERDVRPQQPQRSNRRSHYEDDYDDYDDYDRDDRYGRHDRRDRYDRYDRYEDDYDDYEEKGRGAGFYICLIINIILVLLLIWFLIGLLINLGVLPENLYSTLGYNWFNEHIYHLF